MEALHHLDTLTSIALVSMAALACGLLLIRLRQPAIVGYIIAGVALGPTGLQLVSNTENVQLLAELGVIMLIFLIGMEISLRGFQSVYKTALSAVALQILMAIGLFWIIGHFMDWTFQRIVVFGFATALSSTAVAIKILDETDDLRTPVGRTTVSVLVAQDLALIPMLLIISAFGAGENPSGLIITKLVLSLGFLAVLVRFLARQQKLKLPFSSWIVSRAEIVPLAALGFCFTCAVIAGLLGLSTAYGAFAAGIIIGNSNLRAELHRATEPVQALLLMVFFLSIGLLIDIPFIVENWKTVLLVLSAVTVLKTIVNVVILHLFLNKPWSKSFHSGVVMAQVGEFSFVIIAAGLAASVITDEAYRLMVAVIALSLMISPMWLAIARKLHDMALGDKKS